MHVEPGREVAAVIESDASVWYRIDIDEEQAALCWDIDVQVPVGRTVTAILSDAEGTKLTDARNGQDGRLALRDINRPAGSYFVEVRPSLDRNEPAGFLQLPALTGVGQRVAGGEAEPNDSWSLANRAGGPACCSGVIGEGHDTDVYAYTLEESEVVDCRRRSHHLVLGGQPATVPRRSPSKRRTRQFESGFHSTLPFTGRSQGHHRSLAQAVQSSSPSFESELSDAE